jgi:hypothetical protein
MKVTENYYLTWHLLILAWFLNVAVWDSTTWAQSEVVFITADVDAGMDLESRLFRFDDGSESFAVTAAGGGPSLFQGITVLNGEVLVADLGANAIQQFLPNGTHSGAFASMDDPTFLESDSSGNAYATSLDAVIAPRRFDSTGNLTQTFVHDDLDFPFGIDADATGNVYIANGGPQGSRSLFKFTSDGTFVNSTSLGTIGPVDLAIDEAGGLLYLADGFSNANGIKIFDLSGAAPSIVGSIATPAGAIIAGMHFAAESGNILATNFTALPGSGPPRGLEFSPAGVLLREYFPTDAEVAQDITTFVPEPGSFVTISLGTILLSLNRFGRGRSGT